VVNASYGHEKTQAQSMEQDRSGKGLAVTLRTYRRPSQQHHSPGPALWYPRSRGAAFKSTTICTVQDRSVKDYTFDESHTLS
jgi:hypothetical protein